MSKTEMDLTSISGSAKGLVKGIAIVDLVAESPRPLRTTDITAATGLPHSTAIRLLDVLTQLDLLRADADGRYSLGPHTASWGWVFLDNLDVSALATDLIEALVTETNETVFVGVLDRASVLYVAAASSPQPVRPAATVGSRNPLYCTGIGKSILAHLPAARRDKLLSSGLERRTPNTITDRDALDAELEATRRRGFAIDDVENEEGVRCVAAPVFGHRGEPIAAISISVPAYRLSLDDVGALGPLVRAAARELSARAGNRAQSRDDADDTAIQEGVIA